MDHIHDDNIESIDMEHVADSAFENLNSGQIMHGEVVTIDSDYAYINIGTKSDGRIPIQEFKETPEVGSTFDVMLKSTRLVDGMYEFSMKAAEGQKKWKIFLEWFEDGKATVFGVVKSATNKGKLVEIHGITAFLPFSHAADLRGISESEQEYEFCIKSVDKKKQSVVISRKEFLDQITKERWESFLLKYKTGEHITGEVLKFVEFGAFIRIEGIDALCHRNDMSWKNVFKQRKILKVGESREFIILNINEEDRKISLGLKQLKGDPWESINTRYSAGDKVKGSVVTIVNAGAFIEIEEGVEGFLSNYDLSWTKNTISAKDFLAKGQEIEVEVLEINNEERKLVLGVKQLLDNPWDSIDQRFKVGDVIIRPVKKRVKFGLFVEIEEDIDGLVHVSDISWDDHKRDVLSEYSEGQEVEFKILGIDKVKMKISCGIKQLLKSPWDVISENYPARKVVEGIVSGVTKFGLFVKLEENVEGLIHISEVSNSRIEDLEEHFKSGDKIKAVVLGVDIDKKRLSLSKKSLDVISEKEEMDKILKNTSSNTPTLGDFMNIDLGDKK